jgi:predicted HAD superfamily phosphohydrolase
MRWLKAEKKKKQSHACCVCSLIISFKGYDYCLKNGYVYTISTTATNNNIYILTFHSFYIQGDDNKIVITKEKM